MSHEVFDELRRIGGLERCPHCGRPIEEFDPDGQCPICGKNKYDPVKTSK